MKRAKAVVKEKDPISVAKKGTEPHQATKKDKVKKANKKGRANPKDLPRVTVTLNLVATVENLAIKIESAENVSTMKSKS
jgi:hypothetical protein